MEPFKTTSIRLRCPHCSHEFPQPLTGLKDHDVTACPRCGHRIEIDARSLNKASRDIAKSLSDLKAALKRR